MLPPLRYHQQILDYFKMAEKEALEWYQSSDSQSSYSDSIRLELLKSSYRLNEQDHPAYYAMSREILEQLELEVEPTLFQADAEHDNAALFFTPDAVNIVFYGGILKRMDEEEVKAICAATREVLAMDPNVVPVRAPVTVVGDIHGQVRVVFHQIKTPFDAPYGVQSEVPRTTLPFPNPTA